MMLKLRKRVREDNSQAVLRPQVEAYIQEHPSIITFAFGRKRKVFLNKWKAANLSSTGVGRANPLNRMQSFFAGTELIARSLEAMPRYPRKSNKEWSMHGMDPNGKTVTVHIREDSNTQKNRLLYWISSFHK